MMRRLDPGEEPLLAHAHTYPAYVIEAIDLGVLGRYRVYLITGPGMSYGYNDGWGWSCWTLAGARRKGRRELVRHVARRRRLAERQKRADHTDGSE